jgi:uncharacterized lipoprotein YmbA
MMKSDQFLDLSRRCALVAVLFLALVQPACRVFEPQDDPTRFYVLADVEGETVSSPDGLAVLLPPVAVPAYLESSKMAVRESSSELRYEAFHRWAEPLRGGVTRVVTSEIRCADGIRSVDTYLPAEGAAGCDFRIEVKLLAFEGRADGSISVSAEWKILSGDGSRIHQSGRYVAPESLQWDPGDYAGLADALARAAARIGRELANCLNEIEGG